MKNIKYYIAALIVTLSFSSCNDWLSIYPDNEQTSDQYWRNKEEVEAVLGAGYVKLRDTRMSMLVWGESRGNGLTTDNGMGSFQTTDYTNITNQLEIADILPTNEYAKWASFYSVINMANTLIKYAPTVVEKDQSFNVNVMNSYLSEAYFLRALSYFYLVRTFKDVPYIIEPYVTDEQTYYQPKSDGDYVLREELRMLGGALSAAKEFFEEDNSSNPRNSKGRATKWAIYALIADINLWLGNYDECIAACDMIIGSGRVALIRPDSYDGAEIETKMKEIWFRNFAPSDGNNTAGGNSNESIFEVQYSNALGQTNDYYTIFYTNFRFAVSQYTVQLLSSTALSGDIRGQGVTFTSPSSRYIWKHTGANTSGTTRTSSQNDENWIIYRLAEIYLMKAEALVMKGPGFYEEAVEWINPIRTRVGLPDVASTPDELEMLRLILTERQCEFVGEGKNWFDMLRMGKRNNYRYKTDLIINQIKMRSGYGTTIGLIDSRLSDNNALYMPIHSDEIKSSNGVLIQNPYYERLGN